MKKILHLCADIWSDSRFYQLDPEYEVILIGEEIGVQNYSCEWQEIYWIIANPVCTEFSTAKWFHKENDIEKWMFLVDHCLRIIKEANPKFWVIENPFNWRLKDVLWKPVAVYQPWQYGSPWTKKTALWWQFNMPEPLFKKWEDVTVNPNLYQRPWRPKPSLAFMHKSAIEFIPEFEFAKPFVKNDADFRSLCSQWFAKAFYQSNK